jgi:SHS2 domain-containing protein
MPKYKKLDHTADIGIEVCGKRKEDVFISAVEAMEDLIVDLKSISADEEKTITVIGAGEEDLLINFLREALYLFNGNGWLIKHCRAIDLSPQCVTARLQGGKYNPQKQQMKMEIKAITYHQLSFHKTAQGWKARVFFDV